MYLNTGMQKIDTSNTKWDLSTLLKNDTKRTVEKEIRKTKNRCRKFINKWKNRKDYLKNPKKLRLALDEYEKIVAHLGTTGLAGYYFILRSTLDQSDPYVKSWENKISYTGTKIYNDMQFFFHLVARLPIKKQKEFLKDPSLKEYRNYLKLIFREAKYLLTEPEEKIINLKANTSHSNWVRMTSDFLSREEKSVLDENGKQAKKSISEVTSLMSNKKKKIRDTAVKAFNEIVLKHADVATEEMNSILEDKMIEDDLRKMKRPDLARHLSDDIDSDVVDAMLEAVVSRYGISREFYGLRSKLIGQKYLEYHERNVEFGDLGKKYSYKQSVDLIARVLGNLDEEFLTIFKDFVENGKIDVYPKKGKYGGAFSSAGAKNYPSFVLLNHTNRLIDVTTLAHEMGHAINNELMRKKQNGLNYGISLSTAEVASTFIEDFVVEEIEKNASPNLKLALMVSRLDEAVSTIIRQVACYKFEQELHKTFREKRYLTKEEIGEIFQKNMKAYMGKFVIQSKGSQNWWVRWGHIRSFFYVYSYASGLLISKYLQKRVRNDPKYISKVKKFLSTGLSEPPKEAFKKLGVDITKKEFWDSGLKEITQLLKDTKKLAKKLGKI